MAEKVELIDDVSSVHFNSTKLSLEFLSKVVLSMLIALMLAFPLIYIASNIFFESVEVGRLKKEYKILINENHILTSKLAVKKFKQE